MRATTRILPDDDDDDDDDDEAAAPLFLTAPLVDVVVAVLLTQLRVECMLKGNELAAGGAVIFVFVCAEVGGWVRQKLGEAVPSSVLYYIAW